VALCGGLAFNKWKQQRALMAGSAGCLPANRRSADPWRGFGCSRVTVGQESLAGGMPLFGRRAVYLYIRGQHQDSDDRAERSGVEWNYQSLLPVFKRSERYEPAKHVSRSQQRFGCLRSSEERPSVPSLLAACGPSSTAYLTIRI
jgi:hypothetical protein